VQRGVPAVAGDAHPGQLNRGRRVAVVDRALPRQRRHRAAHHGLDQLRVGEVGRVGVAQHHPAAAQHGHPVGDRARLVQFVRDDHQREPGLPQCPHRGEQRVHLLRGEHAGRFVEDEQPAAAHQDLEDLDALPLADREVPHQRVRVHRQAVPAGGRGDVPGQAPPVEARPAQRQRQPDVLGHGERRHQPHVLEDHADAGRAGRRRRGEWSGYAVDPEFAGVGLVDAVDELHQGALAGTVLAEHRVHLAGGHLEVDPVVGDDFTEAAGQPAYREQRRRGGGRCLKRWMRGHASYRTARSFPPRVTVVTGFCRDERL
jgi:hypothetical protein